MKKSLHKSSFLIAGANFMRLIIFLFIGMIFMPKAVAEANLDNLLNGFDNQCEYSEDLMRFQRALIVEENDNYRVDKHKAKKTLNPKLSRSIDQIRIIDENDEAFNISVSLQGTWHGFEVRELQFLLGKGNGINAISVEFSPPFDPVLKFFGPRIKKSKQNILKSNLDYMEIVTDLNLVDGNVRLYCDTSI